MRLAKLTMVFTNLRFVKFVKFVFSKIKVISVLHLCIKITLDNIYIIAKDYHTPSPPEGGTPPILRGERRSGLALRMVVVLCSLIVVLCSLIVVLCSLYSVLQRVCSI